MKIKDEGVLKAFIAEVKANETWEDVAARTKESDLLPSMTAEEVRFTVYGIRTKYGPESCPLLKQRHRVDRKEKAVEMRKAGISSKVISEKLGVSTATVCEWLAEVLGDNWKSKVPRHVGSEDAKRTKQIMELRGHMSGEKIAERFGITRQRVHQIVSREMARRKMTGNPVPRVSG